MVREEMKEAEEKDGGQSLTGKGEVKEVQGNNKNNAVGERR